MYSIPSNNGFPDATELPAWFEDDPVNHEPFHPQLKIFSFPKLMVRIAMLKRQGDEHRAEELQNAIERAIGIKIQLEVISK